MSETKPIDEGLRPSRIFLLGAWFGVLAGLVEVALRGVQKFVLEEGWLWVSLDVVWMAPLADLCLGLVAAALLVAVQSLLRRPLPRSLVLGLFLFLPVAGPLLTYPRIHVLAGAVLAVGIAVQGGRWLGGSPGLPVRTARRTLVPLAAAVALAGAGIHVAALATERRIHASLPEVSPQRRSVLLLILDTVRASSLGPWGYELDTSPELARIADRGTLFESAWSSSPWTLPAHATIFTGRWDHELSVDLRTSLDDTYPTLAEVLSADGYATAGFSANLIFATRETGLDRGFARFEDFPVRIATVVYSSWLARRLVSRIRRWLGHDEKLVRKHAREVSDDFLSWLDERKGDRPFFAFLNYFDAHAPYVPPDTLSGRFGPVRTWPAPSDLSERREWPAEELAAERAAYDAKLAYLDGEIGRLYRELDRRGVLDRTLVFIASDHGELFGEHGLTDHANSLYRPLLRVPLVVLGPGVPAGRRIERPVSLRDLPATILDVTATGSGPRLPGYSLAPLWHGDGGNPAAPTSPILAEVREGVRAEPWLPISRGDLASLARGGWQYMRNGDGSEELYDLRESPADERDRARERPELVKRLRERLEAVVEAPERLRRARAAGPERERR